MTARWLIDELVPHIVSKCGEEVARVLGMALLWGCMEDLTAAAMPPELRRESIRSKYERIRVMDVGQNPIQKVPIVVYAVEDRVMIDKVGLGYNGDEGPGVAAPPADDDGVQQRGAGVGGGGTQPTADNLVRALIAQNHTLQQQLREVLASNASEHQLMRGDIRRLGHCVGRLANRPAHVVRGFRGDQEEDVVMRGSRGMEGGGQN